MTVSRALALPGASLTHPSAANHTPKTKRVCLSVCVLLCVWQYSVYLPLSFLFVLLSVPVFCACVSFALPSFAYDGGVSGCIWAMLPGALVKLEQSLQVNSLRRPDNTL